MSITTAALYGWAVLAALMAALWVVQRARKVAGIVDVAWAFGTGLLAVWFAFDAALADGSAGHGEDNSARAVLVAVLAGAWAARLGLHLAARLRREGEDGRYRYLRDALGARLQPFMFAFFQVQALWGVLFALPMWAAAQAPRSGLDWLDLLGVAIWAAAIGGELTADRQLERFRADPRNRGRVCREGLWRYSRHPNYFFEWLHWFSYVAIGYGSPWWWLTLAGAAIMYVFLTRITGIPYTESQALRSRGDAYRRYQRTTNAFFPGKPSRLEEQIS
ncbi:MAG: DUF1295 domain-containing protein [Gammaproteobacteria bacterium]|nr:DUF1295 domain-containing protein [Gammaproteobacteria bacterium]